MNRSRKDMSDQFYMGFIDLESDTAKDANILGLFGKLIANERLQIHLTASNHTNQRRYKIMPWCQDKDKIYRSQMLFFDHVPGKVDFYQVTAERTSKLAQEVRRIERPPHRNHKFEFSINYPIMLYKTQEPQQNVLMMVNLAKNIPQKRLILPDGMKFICFVKCAKNIKEE